jgi:hypothetical protein
LASFAQLSCVLYSILGSFSLSLSLSHTHTHTQREWRERMLLLPTKWALQFRIRSWCIGLDNDTSVYLEPYLLGHTSSCQQSKYVQYKSQRESKHMGIGRKQVCYLKLWDGHGIVTLSGSSRKL